MGNYAFRTSALLEELRRNAGAEATTHDFGATC
jgi:ADP-glucose pyrophosphorylase